MEQFFSVFTLTPWDNFSGDTLSHVKLLSLKSILKKFPVIESNFFNDLSSNMLNYTKYSSFNAIKRIVGPSNEDYDISNWYFIWAMDNERRMFQFLIQDEKSSNESEFIMVALAPPEVAKLFLNYGNEAIKKTLYLLSSPQKIKFLIFLKAKGKSIAEDAQIHKFSQSQLDQLKYIQDLKSMPNIKGQWFPTLDPKCPKCNSPLINGYTYQIGLGRVKCQKCGYELKNYL
ncbi:MAG: hypothetical protein ACFFKA_01690 [Candidatus Thorarchaeota archaeon]